MRLARYVADNPDRAGMFVNVRRLGFQGVLIESGVWIHARPVSRFLIPARGRLYLHLKAKELYPLACAKPYANTQSVRLRSHLKRVFQPLPRPAHRIGTGYQVAPAHRV